MTQEDRGEGTLQEVDDFVYDPPRQPWLDVVHLDRDIIVVNKPSGLLSVPGRRPEHRDSVYARVLEAHPLARIAHRLDMDTSGLLVVALRANAERDLHRQFRERTIEKVYLARVDGLLDQEEGHIDLPLTRLRQRPPRSVVDHEGGKPSRTGYRVLRRDEADRSALVALFPETGRSHQLRVHMLSLGHPILGDRFYASPEAQQRAPRLQLHAAALRLDHPYSGVRMTLAAPCAFAPDLDVLSLLDLKGGAPRGETAGT